MERKKKKLKTKTKQRPYCGKMSNKPHVAINYF